MSLLARVAAILAAQEVHFAVFGASAMAASGISRSTLDVDLFTVDDRVLRDHAWADLTAAGISIEIRLGDGNDPLAGVVRCQQDAERPVDLVVGHGSQWQMRALGRSEEHVVLGSVIPVVQPRDVVLFKLFAGGPSDAWDIRQLLAVLPELAPLVDEEVGDLTSDAQELWQRLRAES